MTFSLEQLEAVIVLLKKHNIVAFQSEAFSMSFGPDGASFAEIDRTEQGLDDIHKMYDYTAHSKFAIEDTE